MNCVAQAKICWEAGDYEGARFVFERSFADGTPMTGKAALEYARTLRATSRYAEACKALLAAQMVPTLTTQALVEEAELCWLMGDYDGASNLAIMALQRDPFYLKAQTIRDRVRTEAAARTAFEVSDRSSGRRIAHAAFYVGQSGNFGDQALPAAVRDAMELGGRVATWLPVHVHQEFSEETLDLVNQADALIVGGGGLFLPDTAPNGNSGWQWNIPTERLKRLRVPLALTAVGYNLFRGQQITRPEFRTSLIALCEHAHYVGLRNHGSIDRVRDLLPAALADKIVYFPCPTTVLSRLTDISEAYPNPVEDVLINGAYDRTAMRFGDSYATFLDEMAYYVLAAQRAGYSVATVAHLPGDERLAVDLSEKLGYTLRVYGLYDWSLQRGYAFYRKAGVVVGMRGHGSMIPFGVGTPILSIVSHPKMRFFLEDIQQPDWCVDVQDPQCGHALLDKTKDIMSNQQEYRRRIEVAKDGLLAAILTQSNALASVTS